MKQRYLILLVFVFVSVLVACASYVSYWYFTHSPSYGALDGFFNGLYWVMVLMETGIGVLLLLPLAGLIWGKWKNKRELLLGCLYAELYAIVLAIGIFLNGNR